jgi:D-alanyl-D-alanine carboxypeptidase
MLPSDGPTPQHRRRSGAALIVVALGVTLLAGACSSTSSTSPSTPTTTNRSRSAGSTPGGTRGSAADGSTLAPLDKAALQAIVSVNAKQMMTPGAIAIVRTPDDEFRYAYGTTTWNGSTPVSYTDHVRIGSNTKTMTATAVLQLAQEGALGLDDKVAKYRPDVPNGANITIEQLLNMRSGLYNYSETLELNESLDKTPQRVWTPDELLALAFKNPPYFAPGHGYHYSNTNTILLGLIAEQLDKKPLATIFQDRFFTPLGMKSTSFPPSTTAEIPSRHPQGYMFGTNVATMETAKLSPQQQAEARSGALKPSDVTDENPSWTWAAGQAIATADDLATWVKALGDGSLLNAEWQRKRFASMQPTSDTPGAPEYGLGLALLGPLYGHTGELPGFNSVMAYDPVNKVTVVVWTNLGSAPDGSATATTIARKLISQVYGTSGAASSSGTTTPGGGSVPGTTSPPGTTEK